MDYLPIFIDLRHGSSVVVGGGEVARRKIETLLRASARVKVIAKVACPSVQAMHNAGEIVLELRAFNPSDIDCASIVVAATSDHELNTKIANHAKALHIPVNVVDAPVLCSFIMPSIIDRSPVVVAISTGGAAPVLARILRAKLETSIPASYGRLAELMRDFRQRVRAKISNNSNRRRFWEQAITGSVAERMFEGKYDHALVALENLLSATADAPPQGEVYLVGGGPGDPDLLTFRALRLMQQAEVVVYDRLVAPQIVDLCRKDAERIFVGKQRDHHALDQLEINALLVKLAKQGKRVLRLKGGDPFIFGRGGEEIATLAEQGIAFQIVPGITAASGCAAYAGIPLTHRDYAQQCVFVTAHQQNGKVDLPWDSLVQTQQTLAIYMGMRNLEELSTALIDHGMPASIPAAIIERGTTPQQRVIVGTLATLADKAAQERCVAPSIVIIGEVVNLRRQLAWYESKAPITT
ncbi:MAG: uroporphyrin-III C-methyltransferase/precorrin-2 dehydrogenase/sirohydrochlorin ferrochelatase [Gammaproteobacteria bacterium]